MSITSANISGSCSPPRRMMPAQLTRMSSRGSAPMHCVIAAASRTSSTMALAAAKSAAERAAAASCAVAPVTMTFAPRLASWFPIAAPMPLVPPETNARTPVKTSSRNVALSLGYRRAYAAAARNAATSAVARQRRDRTIASRRHGRCRVGVSCGGDRRVTGNDARNKGTVETVAGSGRVDCARHGCRRRDPSPHPSTPSNPPHPS